MQRLGRVTRFQSRCRLEQPGHLQHMVWPAAISADAHRPGTSLKDAKLLEPTRALCLTLLKCPSCERSQVLNDNESSSDSASDQESSSDESSEEQGPDNRAAKKKCVTW